MRVSTSDFFTPHLSIGAARITVTRRPEDPETGREFAYYETTAGGMGARPTSAGLDATHCHMTNSLNTPIEAFEHTYPFRVSRYEVRRGSGGAGRFRGGDGIRRELQALCDAEVTILSDRRTHAPYGLQGGAPGQPGRNTLIQPSGEERDLGGKSSVEVGAGWTVRIETPGGGGYGDAS